LGSGEESSGEEPSVVWLHRLGVTGSIGTRGEGVEFRRPSALRTFSRMGDHTPEGPGDRPGWRRRLLAERAAIPPAAHREASARICDALEEVVPRLIPSAPRTPGGTPAVISGYHPMRGEPDLASFVQWITAAGFRYALPVGTARHAPLRFLQWSPGDPLEPGLWGILGPAPTAPAVRPDLILAPVVGFDRAGYRLGYGGGYFDRTLAALAHPRPPRFVGVGFIAAELPSIHPHPGDVRMDAIATDAGVLWFGSEGVRPPSGSCPAPEAP
jgi:5-formyltetrahydrofolate cyclo-ligase